MGVVGSRNRICKFIRHEIFKPPLSTERSTFTQNFRLGVRQKWVWPRFKWSNV